jgi:hypothetical protein
MSSCKFFQILVHQTLDTDPGSGSAIRKNAGSGSVSGSALNQCGSETLVPYLYVSSLFNNKYTSNFRLKPRQDPLEYLENTDSM